MADDGDGGPLRFSPPVYHHPPDKAYCRKCALEERIERMGGEDSVVYKYLFDVFEFTSDEKGHKNETVYINPSGQGQRICKDCAKMWYVRDKLPFT